MYIPTACLTGIFVAIIWYYYVMDQIHVDKVAIYHIKLGQVPPFNFVVVRNTDSEKPYYEMYHVSDLAHPPTGPTLMTQDPREEIFDMNRQEFTMRRVGTENIILSKQHVRNHVLDLQVPLTQDYTFDVENLTFTIKNKCNVKDLKYPLTKQAYYNHLNLGKTKDKSILRRGYWTCSDKTQKLSTCIKGTIFSFDEQKCVTEKNINETVQNCDGKPNLYRFVEDNTIKTCFQDTIYRQICSQGIFEHAGVVKCNSKECRPDGIIPSDSSNRPLGYRICKDGVLGDEKTCVTADTMQYELDFQLKMSYKRVKFVGKKLVSSSYYDDELKKCANDLKLVNLPVKMTHLGYNTTDMYSVKANIPLPLIRNQTKIIVTEVQHLKKIIE